MSAAVQMHVVEYLAAGLCADSMCSCGSSTERRAAGGGTVVVCRRSETVLDSWPFVDSDLIEHSP